MRLNFTAGNFENVRYDMVLRIPQQPESGYPSELIDYTAMVAAIASAADISHSLGRKQ